MLPIQPPSSLPTSQRDQIVQTDSTLQGRLPMVAPLPTASLARASAIATLEFSNPSAAAHLPDIQTQQPRNIIPLKLAIPIALLSGASIAFVAAGLLRILKPFDLPADEVPGYILGPSVAVGTTLSSTIVLGVVIANFIGRVNQQVNQQANQNNAQANQDQARQATEMQAIPHTHEHHLNDILVVMPDDAYFLGAANQSETP